MVLNVLLEFLLIGLRVIADYLYAAKDICSDISDMTIRLLFLKVNVPYASP